MFWSQKCYQSCFLQGDSGGPVFIPVVIEKQDLGLNDHDIHYLAKHNKTQHSNITEAEVMANIIRDPILIGVTRYSSDPNKRACPNKSTWWNFDKKINKRAGKAGILLNTKKIAG